MPSDLHSLTSADGAQLSVSLHGAHVCSWRTPDGVERLFLSPLTKWDGHAAIRGGIPVVFPQFSSRGPLPKHGFARNTQWALIASEVRTNGEGFIHLTMQDSTESRLQFPHKFTLDLHLTFSGTSLDTALFVTNTGAQAFDFTCALHTYLSTQIAQAAIHGLAQSRYENSLGDSALQFDSNRLLHINAEVDSLFFQVNTPVALISDNSKMTMQQVGFSDVVVWNPWSEGSAAIADLEDDAYQHFVCIESAAVEQPVTLGAGLQWRGEQQLTVANVL
ncbi:D-hexose-6-phosphate mutarotase [Glaciimonas sp. PCH181]|uniref:D-hexose-6-phosphate mutarotase n=1 Tax=Glaciimonas sp. PCH181 TaxID=2133943 RepID=UPI000D3868C1|nr:D-hexose-6-phosphate mutarotase [Glaciimonas sp. PCH181]PUA18145.1 D-hexose-6-phosphate mutarotase [Glaciimonas sp. PCH181]